MGDSSSKHLNSSLDRARKTNQLSLRGQNRKSIPPKVFELERLVSLDCSQNSVGPSLDIRISRFSHLKTLVLSGNRLQELPEEFAGLVKLETLDLDNNRFTVVPPILFQFSRIKKLSLAHNRISQVPDGISHLARSLAVLDLSSNSIIKLNPKIDSMTSLRDLNLNDNAIEELPSEMGNLDKLQHVRLKNNRLSDVPVSLYVGSSVYNVELDGNPIFEGRRFMLLPGFEHYSERRKANLDKGVAGALHVS